MTDLSQLELRGNTVQEALDAINHAFVVYDAQERFVWRDITQLKKLETAALREFLHQTAQQQ